MQTVPPLCTCAHSHTHSHTDKRSGNNSHQGSSTLHTHSLCAQSELTTSHHTVPSRCTTQHVLCNRHISSQCTGFRVWPQSPHSAQGSGFGFQDLRSPHSACWGHKRLLFGQEPYALYEHHVITSGPTLNAPCEFHPSSHAPRGLASYNTASTSTYR